MLSLTHAPLFTFKLQYINQLYYIIHILLLFSLHSTLFFLLDWYLLNSFVTLWRSNKSFSYNSDVLSFLVFLLSFRLLWSGFICGLELLDMVCVCFLRPWKKHSLMFFMIYAF